MRRIFPREFIVPLIVACALFMEQLDSTIITTALPAIAHSLGEDPLRLNLAITAYLLSLAIFIPLSGWMADRFGGRTVFAGALVVFTLGSIACGLASSLHELVAFRILQGMGGAMMVPVGRFVMLRTVPKVDLVRAMAYLSIPALIGPVVGPPLGGLIVTITSWRWIFFVNVPICALGVALALTFIEDFREKDVRPLDLAGFVMSAIGLSFLLAGLIVFGRGAAGGLAVGALLGVGILACSIYVWHARHTAYPIIDLSLLRIPTFNAATVGGSLFRIGVGALPFLLPLMLQLGFGLSPLASGLLTFAGAAGSMLLKFTARPIIRAWGFRQVLVANAVISSLFLMACALFGPSTPHWAIFLVVLAGGYFRSLQFTSLATLAYADVPAAQMSRASSFASMAQQLSVGFGVAVGALFLHATLWVRGATALGADDFAPAFVAVGVVSLLSVVQFQRMAPDAGAEVSGHRDAQPRQPAQ